MGIKENKRLELDLSEKISNLFADLKTLAITTQNSISGSDIIKTKITWIVEELKRSVISHNKENLQIQKEYFSRSV